MSTITTLLQGAHRGGTSLLARLPPTAVTVLGPHLRVADPHPARAELLGALLPAHEQGLRDDCRAARTAPR